MLILANCELKNQKTGVDSDHFKELLGVLKFTEIKEETKDKLEALEIFGIWSISASFINYFLNSWSNVPFSLFLAFIHSTTPPTNNQTRREIGAEAVWTLSSAKVGNGVEQLRDDNTNTFWQSDGSQPHLINIQFMKKKRIQ